MGSDTSQPRRVCFAVSLLAPALLAVTPPAAAQDEGEKEAFGIAMGQPIATLRVLKKSTRGRYFVRAPKPYFVYDDYLVIAFPETGVCAVKGIGFVFLRDSAGISVQVQFNAVQRDMAERYGESEDFGENPKPLPFVDDENFARKLNSGERQLKSIWSRKAGAALPDYLAGVELTANALPGGQDTYLTNTYYFSNFEECRALATKETTDVEKR